MATSTAPARVAARTPRPPLLARRRFLDVLIMSSYLLASLALYRDLWLTLPHGYLVDSGQDQNLFEWFFAVQAHAVADGRPTLFSTLQNHPVGVNLMANTAMPGLAVPLTPLTLLAGPSATWAVVLTGGLAGTAAGWYWLFARRLVRSRWSAAIGGGCCAFAPPVVSHAHAHPNFTAMFLLPVIVLVLARLCDGTRVRRDGTLLGLLLAWQVMIGEEPLLLVATGLVVFALAWLLVAPRHARAALPGLALGLGIAAAVSIVLVGYPLWVQFTGPGSYHALPHGPAGNDLATFGALPRQSLGGQLLNPDQVVPNPTEQNAFLGWPLVVLVLVAIGWLWRSVPARIAALTALGTAALSAGSWLTVHGHPTGIPGPWLLLHRLPLYESVIESRLMFACVPAIGMLLALASDRVLCRPPVRPTAAPSWLTDRRLWFAALVLAVLPVLPARFTTEPRAEAPALFSSGAWREYVRPGRAVVPVPLPEPGDAGALHWQVAADLGFPIAEGYFVGPGADGAGTYGAPKRPTSRLLTDVAVSGVVPPIGPEQRTAAIDDLRFWRADLVVLAGHPNRPALRAAVEGLLGPGQERDGVLVWDVRPLTG